jgi:hypothetical protein
VAVPNGSVQRRHSVGGARPLDIRTPREQQFDDADVATARCPDKGVSEGRRCGLFPFE